MRTPVGARGWDTPIMRGGESESTRRRPGVDDYDELEGGYGEGEAGPGPETRRAAKKKRVNRIRDDLPLDLFQLNYTSEDNAAFVQIVEEENNRRKEERWGWAWEKEAKAEIRRLEGEERRKMILDQTTSGNWRVNADGQRLIGGLAEGSVEKDVGEAWKDTKIIMAAPAGSASASKVDRKGDSEDIEVDEDVAAVESGKQAVILQTDGTSKALVTRKNGDASKAQLTSKILEEILPDDHPLNRALTEAGLPATALMSVEDGALVPSREIPSGGGEGRGRGMAERDSRGVIERTVVGDHHDEYLPSAGSGADQWKYKVS